MDMPSHHIPISIRITLTDRDLGPTRLAPQQVTRDQLGHACCALGEIPSPRARRYAMCELPTMTLFASDSAPTPASIRLPRPSGLRFRRFPIATTAHASQGEAGGRRHHLMLSDTAKTHAPRTSTPPDRPRPSRAVEEQHACRAARSLEERRRRDLDLAQVRLAPMSIDETTSSIVPGKRSTCGSKERSSVSQSK